MCRGKSTSYPYSAFPQIILILAILPIAYGIVPPLPIMGESSSLDEAVGLAENTGFTIKLPVDTPSGLQLTDIRLGGKGPLDLQRPWVEGVSYVSLIFSKEKIPENMTLPELMVSGGIMAIEKKKDPRDVQIIEELRETGGQKDRLSLVEIDEKLGYYVGEDEILPWRSELTWIDDETYIEMLASPEHYNQEDLIRFAESFTDWSAIKTSTTTTTVIITSTSQTVSTMTKTLTDTVEPTIYAWAIGATIIAIVLTAIIVSKRWLF